MMDDSQDEPSDRWLVAWAVVLASLVFGSFLAWVVDVAGRHG